MKSTHSNRIGLTQILLCTAMVIALVAVREANAGDGRDHLVTDWSHRRLVFSEPNSLMKRFELSANPRYVQQLRRRHAEGRGDRNEWRWRRAPDDSNHIQGDWSMDMGAGAKVGAGNYPAKFSFDPTSAYCATPAPPVGQQPDFVVYNTSLAGSGTQATIVGFDNLYSSCTGGTPLTYWAYNTGTTGAVVTSPVLSYDGTQVAFVQNTGSGANLVVLRWKANNGTLTSPIVPSTGPCTALTAPCMTIVPFSTANSDPNTTDATSSPFYDYSQDVIYVGDGSAFLHKFTTVFTGTPTEVVSTGPSSFWPANLGLGFGRLNSPVFVGGAYNEVIVTDNDGLLYSVNSTVGGLYPTGFNFFDPKLADIGFDDGPLVDVTTGMIYVFARTSSTFVTPSDVASVFQIPMPATPANIHNSTFAQAVVSNSATAPASAFYAGTFDDTYYSSGTNSGYLYVCSTSGTVNAIWGIPITSAVMGTPFLGPTITTANVGCSPITEFNNTSTNNDRIFLSVTGSAITGDLQIKCPAASGCIMSFDVDNPMSTSTPTSGTGTVAGGTSAIVIDNASSAGGASQVYFTPLSDQVCTTSGGMGGCAIQASQSLLQ